MPGVLPIYERVGPAISHNLHIGTDLAYPEILGVVALAAVALMVGQLHPALDPDQRSARNG